ncbi:MAG: hypothetical protein J5492_05985, partial [Oxalobacter sp.]|nr:hypothetical protein [Oxalobacter sp.]
IGEELISILELSFVVVNEADRLMMANNLNAVLATIISYRTHIHIAEGIELVVDPAKSAINHQTLRRFVAHVLDALETAKQTQGSTED